jgi:ABC-type multidrug transport system ATPase subunit
LENIVFAARMHSVSRPVERARESLRAAGLESIGGCQVNRLSQGMRQRLAIVRAALHEPQLILLDEPFANLDAEGQGWLEQLVYQWRRAARTVCYASHDTARNHELADRKIVLDGRRIVETMTTVHRAQQLQRLAG